MTTPKVRNQPLPIVRSHCVGSSRPCLPTQYPPSLVRSPGSLSPHTKAGTECDAFPSDILYGLGVCRLSPPESLLKAPSFSSQQWPWWPGLQWHSCFGVGGWMRVLGGAFSWHTPRRCCRMCFGCVHSHCSMAAWVWRTEDLRGSATWSLTL